MSDVVIVGGGIAGLATAYELHAARRPVRRCSNARPRAGGVIFSEEIDGYTIDARPRCAADPEAGRHQALRGARARRSPGADEAAAPRLHPARRPAASAAGRVGARHPDAHRPVRAHAPVLVAGQAAHGRGTLRAAHAAMSDDESIGAFMTRRFGARSHDLPGRAAAGRHPCRRRRPAVHPGAVPALRRSRAESWQPASRVPRVAGSAGAVDRTARFKSLPGGLSEMIRALRRRAAGRDRPAQRAGPVASPSTTPSRPFCVETADGEPCPMPRAVVLATPAYVTAGLLAQRRRRTRAHCATSIPYVSTGTSRSRFAAPMSAHPLNGSGFVVPRVEKSGILAASWLSSKWPHRAPDDRVLLRAFVGGARDPRALDDSDAELVEQARGGAQTAARHRRRPAVDARLPLGARQRAARSRSPRALAAIERALAPTSGLSSPAVAFAAWASPTASPTAARRRGR